MDVNARPRRDKREAASYRSVANPSLILLQAVASCIITSPSYWSGSWDPVHLEQGILWRGCVGGNKAGVGAQQGFGSGSRDRRVGIGIRRRRWALPFRGSSLHDGVLPVPLRRPQGSRSHSSPRTPLPISMVVFVFHACSLGGLEDLTATGEYSATSRPVDAVKLYVSSLVTDR